MLYIGSSGETSNDLRAFLSLLDNSDESVVETFKTVYRVVAYERYKMTTDYLLLNEIRILVDRKAKPSEKFKLWTKRYFNVEIDKIDFKKDGLLISDQITEVVRYSLSDNDIKGFQSIVDSKTQLLTMTAIRFKGKSVYFYFIINLIEIEILFSQMDGRVPNRRYK